MAYIATRPTVILVDGQRTRLSAGDTVPGLKGQADQERIDFLLGLGSIKETAKPKPAPRAKAD